MYGSGGSGRIRRVDGTTGAIALFAELPNVIGTSGRPPGLGNIAFDAAHQQFFVTNHEDGMIYRLDMVGTVLDTFDPFNPDDGAPSFCPLGERLWGVGVHQGRLYFAVWAEDTTRPSVTEANTIWSIAITPGGPLDPSDLTLEVTVPPLDPAASQPTFGSDRQKALSISEAIRGR